MKTKVFGWTGVEVAIIGQGTWKMAGSRREREREAQAHERAAAAQRMAIDLQREHAAHSRQLADRRAAEQPSDD